MTIIVACRGVMAADSITVSGNVHFRCVVPKIVKVPNDGFAGGSGLTEDTWFFREWMAGRIVRPEICEPKDFSALWLKADGSVWRCGGSLRWRPGKELEVIGEIAAEDFCRGAMAAGADAETAVRLACEHCVWARSPVQVERLGG